MNELIVKSSASWPSLAVPVLARRIPSAYRLKSARRISPGVPGAEQYSEANARQPQRLSGLPSPKCHNDNSEPAVPIATVNDIKLFSKSGLYSHIALGLLAAHNAVIIDCTSEPFTVPAACPTDLGMTIVPGALTTP